MPKFIIYEVQNESRIARFRYEVDASSEEEARQLCEEGELEAFEDGAFGESHLHDSAFVVRDPDEDSDDAYRAAFERLCSPSQTKR